MADSVGERIRYARRARGLTLDALAAAVGTDAGTLSRIERGLRDPRVSQLKEIAAALSITAEDIVARTWQHKRKGRVT